MSSRPPSLGRIWNRGITRYIANQALESLVGSLSDQDLDEILEPAPLPADDDARDMALDEARIAAETATGKA
mgnify:CR=1 FL=1